MQKIFLLEFHWDGKFLVIFDGQSSTYLLQQSLKACFR